MMIARTSCLATILLLFTAASPNLAATAPAPLPDLSGTWLPESATWESTRDLLPVKLSMTANNFSLSGYRRNPNSWTGTYTVGQGGDKRNLDLQTNSFDIVPPGQGSLLVPAGTVHGIYKLEPSPDGDRLTVCLNMHSGSPRPTTFTETYGAEDIRTITFIRANDNAPVAPPKAITVTVFDPDGHPVANATVFNSMSWRPPIVTSDNGKTYFLDAKSPSKWYYSTMGQTGADGTLHVPSSDFGTKFDILFAVRLPGRHLMGIVSPNTTAFRRGTITIPLQNERTIRGTCSRDASNKAGSFFIPTIGWESNGNDLVQMFSDGGKFELPLAPGDYWLRISSSDTYLYRQKITISPGTDDILLPAITLNNSELPALIGKPAPAIPGVYAWKNGPIDFPSLKGKVVLLDYWGYWCGGCVAQMPTLFRLHDKYKDKGLAIVTVHVGADSEVDTVEKLDARTAYLRNGFWRGRDVPFPTALVSGRPSGHGRAIASNTYGVLGYPTTIVIGRDGNVLGALGNQIHWKLTDDEKSLDANIEKLLASPQPN